MSATARLYRRSQDWQLDEDGHESVVDVWEVLTTSETDTLTTVLAASGLPAKGSSHVEKTTAICTTQEAQQDQEVLTRWLVSLRFTTNIQTREDAVYNAQRIKGGMKSGSKDVPAFYDARGYPLVNTAGDLYEGLAKKKRLRVVNCTYNFITIPNWFFELADTLNNAAVTIHGATYDIGTCKLTDIDMPDEPSRDPGGQLYWPVTYNITIDPDGWYVILPNKGPHELVYQTRASSAAVWQDATFALYSSKTPTTDRQVLKRRIQSSEQQDLAADIWLDANGQAQKVITLLPTQLGTGGMTAGSTTLTLASGAFDTTGLHKGALIRVAGVGKKTRWLEARIDTVTSSTVATLSAPARTNGSGKAVWVSGAIVNYFILDDLADWTSVPLPNNQP